MRTALTALVLGALAALPVAGCSTAGDPAAETSTTSTASTAATPAPPAEHPLGEDETGAFRIVSPAFAADGTIPARYTCDGDDVSPPIQWNAVPDGTQSLALVVVDHDAPVTGGSTHWVVAGLDPPAGGLGEATKEGVAGRNDAGTSGWSGPCPPSGTHSYVFTLYAFDHATDFGAAPTRAAVESEPGVRATATLTGRYR